MKIITLIFCFSIILLKKSKVNTEHTVLRFVYFKQLSMFAYYLKISKLFLFSHFYFNNYFGKIKITSKIILFLKYWFDTVFRQI